MSTIAPNRVKENHVYVVRCRHSPAREWLVLAKDATEAKAVVLAGAAYLGFQDLEAEEAEA